MLLPACIRVCPVEIPGRGRLSHLRPLLSVPELAARLVSNLPLQGTPCVLFGTCLGAIVAYEMAAQLGVAPRHGGTATRALRLMVSAVAPPHLYARAVMKLYLQRRLSRSEPAPVEEAVRILSGWRALPKDQVLRAFEAGNFAGVAEMKANDRLFQRVAPIGVNDIIMAVQYR